ncbi:hypothetical protein KSF78_0009405 [Schistosoma japonicum]|uniref:SJCWL01.CXW n=1 Tax=Schistosoma japonicum TaxID=6182 RepID=Q5I4G9_SCHJA|nr:SJCWL01.CXW [Schistosoma japonicum]KAH8857063.1 hypothetical protein KSF78_0009405 [Schistosoma japonicum]KAH8857064.1 hypothetical protein KSF78_0009405 [Schistosoma japonicum]
MDLDDYVISAVQIPPGCNSRKLLDISNPHVEKFLRKFMKRLVKKPNTLFSRVLPTLDDRGDSLSLCVTDCQTPYIPYVIRASDSSWHIRQFPTHRLSVRSSKVDNDCIILDEDGGGSCFNSLKRPHMNVEYSPQLITSSDEEINPPSKTQRRE